MMTRNASEVRRHLQHGKYSEVITSFRKWKWEHFLF